MDLSELGRRWHTIEAAKDNGESHPDRSEQRERIHHQLSEAWAESKEHMPMLYTVDWDAEKLEACTDESTYGSRQMYGVCAELARACLMMADILAEQCGGAMIKRIRSTYIRRFPLPTLLEQVRVHILRDASFDDGEQMRTAVATIMAWIEGQGMNAQNVLEWTLDGDN